jgi:uncharacterized protein DUF4193
MVDLIDDEPEEEEKVEKAEEEEADPADPGQVEASLDELLAKRVESGEEEEESLLELQREERTEPLSIRAAPKQPNEFICSNCHLVKHNSQLADRKRTLCRDCV